MLMYRIRVTESERGWGSNSWYEHFNTVAEAQARINLINSANTSPVVPDYYMQADNEIVVVTELS